MYQRPLVGSLKHLYMQMFLHYGNLAERFFPISRIYRLIPKFWLQDANNEENTGTATSNPNGKGTKKGKKTAREKGSITRTN